MDSTATVITSFRARRTAPARRIVVLGRQGSGKGTQSSSLARLLGVPHVSAGDALRRAVRSGSLLGGAVEKAMAGGQLVNDGLAAAAVADLIGSSAGFVLDGFPRTVEQAVRLEEMLAGASIDLAVRIDVPVETVIARLERRRVCVECGLDHPGAAQGATCNRCGGEVAARADDTPEAIRARLAIYDRHETALCAWLRSRTRLECVDGSGNPEEVARRIWAAVRQDPPDVRTVATPSRGFALQSVSGGIALETA